MTETKTSGSNGSTYDFAESCLMGFRAREVCTWRAEYIDYVNGETLVLDAKKHELLLVPLNVQVARHAKEGLSLETLRRILRHTDFETTMRYVRSLVFWEDVKRDYDKFQLGLMQEAPLTHGL